MFLHPLDIYYRPHFTTNKTLAVASILSLVMENIYFTPWRGLRTLLGGIRSIINSRISMEDNNSQLPISVDLCPLAWQFNLNPVIRHYVACPSCHTLYCHHPGNALNHDHILPVLALCSNKRTLDSPSCQTPLWKTKDLGNGRNLTIPERRYFHQDLKSWLGHLLSHKGMEDLLDHSYPPNLNANSSIDDIWQCSVFWGLKDRFGAPFLPGNNGDGRLVFSMSVDSFNPFHNKPAKQSVSSTGIWLVLLNLPQHLRYLEENMYLAGVVPGLDKPSKEDLYPYLNLVMDNILKFWNQGVHFSRTFRELYGRLFWAMIIPLICDMLAACQVAGFGSATSHNFCTFCSIDIDDIDVQDKAEWPDHDVGHMRNIAQRWKDTPSEKERKEIFEKYGIRWLPLYRLPYWNPVLYTVIDSMHALDLNLLQNHCQSLFQINTKHPGGDGLSGNTDSHDTSINTEELQKQHQKCAEVIQQNGPQIFEDILGFPRHVLFRICTDNNIVHDGQHLITSTKWILASNIMCWVSTQMSRSVV